MKDHQRCHSDDPLEEGRYHLHDVRFEGINFSCFVGGGCQGVASEIAHMSKKRIMVMLSKDKL